MLRRSSLPLSALSALALLAPGCFTGVDDPDADPGADEVSEDEEEAAVDPPAIDPGTYLTGIDADFTDAADEFGVPAELLQAIGHVETGWQMIQGEVEFEGQGAAHGVLALRGEALVRAAELAEVSVEAVKTDRRQHLRAGAALLSAYADELEIDRADLGAWAPAVARFSGIPEAAEAALASYVHRDVYATLRAGVTVRDLAGAPVATLDPVDALPDFADPPPEAEAAAGPDYAASIWRPSPNYSSRPSGDIGKVAMVIIHTCEGSYSGCWGWLVNSQAGVSAHYVVKEDGSEISQLVKESNKAWHIGASYKCSLNGNLDCWRDGYNANSFTVGIEHAGYASQANWNSNLIDKSAKLTCDITKGHGIPRDNKHIVAHGKLQPYDRVDPGPNWPWSTYLSKVNTHCGAQQPPAPEPQPGGTIIVDSNNSNNDPAKAKIAVSGNWTSTSSTAGYYGTGYFYAETAAVSDAAEFSFYLSADATKTVDAWWTAGTNRAAAAPFIAFDPAGNKLGTVNVNQQQNGQKWNQLGSFKFKKGWNKVVLSRWTAAGSVVIADAVRIR
ncbi:MAG: N-acetylmuramoyl-L-alanine amidase [Myxococcales bacterium]|nr:N-acetylmuramoyl-L-alanine amidase [Myxococcales bacterium]